MNAPANVPAQSQGDREIVLTRTFEAPRERVWRAWTDPVQLARWWGPVGFSTTTQRMEVKPGGVWRFIMHGPDGRDYQNQITYLEVDPPARLSYKHGGDTEGDNCEPIDFQVTVLFEADGDRRTRITMRSLFSSASAKDFVVRQYNAVEGGKQHLVRLGEHLSAGRSPGSHAPDEPGQPFTITRVFKAPRDLVYTLWTQQDHLQRWFGPKGVTLPMCSLDLRLGGEFRYCMRMPDGAQHWAKWIFREIVPGERLVFVVMFTDEQGTPARNPWNSQWPLEMLSTVTFTEHAGIGKGTVVTVRWEAISASDIERRTFDEGHASMMQGWGGTMDQLAAYVAGATASIKQVDA